MDYLYTKFDRVMDKRIQVSTRAARTDLCFFVGGTGRREKSIGRLNMAAFRVITHPLCRDHVASGRGCVGYDVWSSPPDSSHIPDSTIQVKWEGCLCLRHPV